MKGSWFLSFIRSGVYHSCGGRVGFNNNLLSGNIIFRVLALHLWRVLLTVLSLLILTLEIGSCYPRSKGESCDLGVGGLAYFTPIRKPLPSLVVMQVAWKGVSFPSVQGIRRIVVLDIIGETRHDDVCFLKSNFRNLILGLPNLTSYDSIDRIVKSC